MNGLTVEFDNGISLAERIFGDAAVGAVIAGADIGDVQPKVIPVWGRCWRRDTDCWCLWRPKRAQKWYPSTLNTVLLHDDGKKSEGVILTRSKALFLVKSSKNLHEMFRHVFKKINIEILTLESRGQNQS